MITSHHDSLTLTGERRSVLGSCGLVKEEIFHALNEFHSTFNTATHRQEITDVDILDAPPCTIAHLDHGACEKGSAARAASAATAPSAPATGVRVSATAIIPFAT